MHNTLDYLPNVSTEDAIKHLDELVIPDIIHGRRSDTYLAVFKACPPATTAEAARYVELSLTMEGLRSKEHAYLEDKINGYKVSIYPSAPVSGYHAREVLADFLVWAATYHNDDPQTIAYMTATYAPGSWQVKVHDRAEIHTKVLTKNFSDKWIASIWDDVTTDHRLNTFLVNPFKATSADIARTRGEQWP